jgi:hypothetical protein
MINYLNLFILAVWIVGSSWEVVLELKRLGELARCT